MKIKEIWQRVWKYFLNTEVRVKRNGRTGVCDINLKVGAKDDD